MELIHFKKNILRKDISKLFEKVSEKCGSQKLKRIFSHIVESPEIVEIINKENKKAGLEPTNIIGYYNEVTSKVLKNSRDLVNYINYLDGKNEFTKVPNVKLNLKLLVYLQITETTFVYKVFWNSLRALIGADLNSEVFDDFKYGSKLNKLMKLYDACGLKYECIIKWNSLIDRDFRNTIAHNDFYLEKDTMLTSSGMTGVIKRNARNNPVIYSEKQIDEYYEKAVNFNEAIIDEIHAWNHQCNVIY